MLRILASLQESNLVNTIEPAPRNSPADRIPNGDLLDPMVPATERRGCHLAEYPQKWLRISLQMLSNRLSKA